MNTLVDLFKTFQGRGEKTAIVYRTGVRRFVFSYQQLHEYSLKGAQWLSSQGVQKGDRVLIWAPNSPWWQVAFWGCVARGAVVVPVDFMSGRERAERIVELTEAKLIVQSQYKLDRIPLPTSLRATKGSVAISLSTQETEIASSKTPRNDRLVNIEDLEYLLQNIQPTQNIADSKPEDIAELIYTSGTTGDPKGVILTHKNIVSNLIQVNTHVPVVRENWNFLSLLPLSHVFEQIAGSLTPLYRGGSIVYVKTLKPSAIMEALGEEDIYALPIVPRLLQALKSSIERELQAKHLYRAFQWLANNHPRSFAFYPIKKKFGRHFKLFISGAAALDASTAEFWSRMGFRVLEGYGITECSPVLSASTFEKQIIGGVGRPLEGVEIKIVNQERNKESKNQENKTIGEIIAKGPNVFPGYYQNEEATKKAFTEDGWFKTGDMGYFDAEGNLYIKGRSKEMIVTGAGINVYPDDIEPILNRITGVKEACVIGVDKGAGEEVHAVLILNEDLLLSLRGFAKPASTDPSRQRQAEADVSQGGQSHLTRLNEIATRHASLAASLRSAEEVARDDNNSLAKSIIEQANSKLDPLQHITSFSLWPEHEFPKTTTMKVQKFKVRQMVENVETQNFVSLQSTDKLTDIMAKVTGKSTGEVLETSVLVSDLGLTSVARLELVNFLEQEFRLDLEDTAITQTTTVADVRQMIEKREKHHARVKSRMWAHRPLLRVVRYIFDNLINKWPFLYFVRLKKECLENLKELKGPVIFIANHTSFWDGPCIYVSLPLRFRYHFAQAATEELFFKENRNLIQRIIGRIYFEYLSFCFGTFLVAEKGAFRSSLKIMGSLIDHGVSILIFPEGERTLDGKMTSFQAGLAIMVKELKVPVVPIKIAGVYELWPRGVAFPKRGSATIRYGKPIFFTDEQSGEILEKSRQAIAEL